MESDVGIYILPFVPFIARIFQFLAWPKLMNEVLSEEAQERDPQRTLVLSLAGFSFTAVTLLAVVDASELISIQISVWYALVSFVAFFSALNLLAYKSRRWHDHLTAAFTEAGTFSLLLTVLSLLWRASFSPAFFWAAFALALGSWTIDHGLRVWFESRYLHLLDQKKKGRGQTTYECKEACQQRSIKGPAGNRRVE